MSIVRELLISVGFKVDNKGANNVNKSIGRIISRYRLMALAAVYAFSRVARFFTGMAKEITDADTLARRLNITLAEIAAIQRAGLEFGFDEKQINSVLTTVNKLFEEMRSGSGDTLKNISKSLNFEVDEVQDNVVSILFKILQGLNDNLIHESDRLRVSGTIFGEDLSRTISDVSKNLDAFRIAIKNFSEYGKQVEASTPDFERYQKAVSDFSNAWRDFMERLTTTLLPTFTFIFDRLTDILNSFRANPNYDPNGYKKYVPQFLNDIDDYFKSLLPASWFSQSALATPNITINNDISVPPGSTEDQAKFMSEEISQRVQDTIDNSWRQIQNNSPMVE